MRSKRRLFNPTIFDVRVSVLFGLYRQRLSNHTVTELLACGGIAVGVALVFGVLVANSSVLGSTREIIHAVDGSASLELAARSSDGFSESLANRAASLPGIEDSALLLRENAVIQGPRGRKTVQLIGVTAGLIGLGGSATKNLGAGALLLAGGVGLPAGVAEPIGAQPERRVTLIANGAIRRTEVRAVLDTGAIGPLASSGIAVALLPHAQALAGRAGRVTEVLIRPSPGQARRVERELQVLAAGRLNVRRADAELRLLNETAKPTSQSSTLFAAISLMVGFLLAANALLLTVPQRRRQFAGMRSQGYDSRQVMLIFTFQALALGLIASLIGVAAGGVLARTVFREAPVYLSVAFPVSGHQEIHSETVLIAFGAGIGAALVVSLTPIFDLISKEPVDAVFHKPGEPGQAIGAGTVRALAMLGVTVIVVVSVAVLAIPSLTVFGGVLLALASLCFIPLLFRVTTRAMRQFAKRYHGGMVAVTVIELDAAATRAVALAGVAALAVYGSTAIGGARGDLIRGLDTATVEFFDTAGIWVTMPTNDLGTTSFHAGDLAARIAREPGIASVRDYQGGLLDVGGRRLWLRARPPTDPAMLQASQIVAGDLASGTARLRAGGGWAAVSDGFAKERGLRVGDSFLLPTPTGLRPFRVAVMTSNVGWPPGAITLNAGDYRRYWQTSDPAALEIDLKPGVSPTVGKHTVARVLGEQRATDGLRVQTAAERITQFENNARQGLRSLAEIANLLLVMAALALAAALSTAIYQRRRRLASLKAQGFDRMQLWRSLLLEGTVVVVIGCLDGAILGLYGHALADRYLRLSTGFPAPFTPGGLQIVLTLLILAGISLMVIALPGYSAAGVPTRATFQE